MRPIRLAVLCLLSALIAAPKTSAWAQAAQPAAPPAPSRAGPPGAGPGHAPAAAAPAPGRTAPPAAATPFAGSRVDINAATEAQLESLPGVGPVRAKAIIASRPYADVRDLEAKKVLTAGVLSGIRDRIALANINTSSAADMQRTLPGIGDARAKAIVAGRPYASPAELVTKKVLTPGVLDGIKDLIAY